MDNMEHETPTVFEPQMTPPASPNRRSAPLEEHTSKSGEKTVCFHFLSMITPPASPSNAEAGTADDADGDDQGSQTPQKRRKSRPSLSDWYSDAGSDAGEQSDEDSDVGAESEEEDSQMVMGRTPEEGKPTLDDWYGETDEKEEPDEGNLSTTASEAGCTKVQRPKSPKKSSERKKPKNLPNIFYVGDDFEELAKEWGPDLPQISRTECDSPPIDSTEVDLQFSKDDVGGSDAAACRRRRQSVPARYSSGPDATMADVKALLENLSVTCQSVGSRKVKNSTFLNTMAAASMQTQYDGPGFLNTMAAASMQGVSMKSSGDAKGSRASAEAEDSDEEDDELRVPMDKTAEESYLLPMDQAAAALAHANAKKRVYQYSKMIIRVPDLKMQTEYGNFEGGLTGHLKDLLKEDSNHIDVMCLLKRGKNGKKRFAAPTPEEFAERLKPFAERFNKRFENKDGKIMDGFNSIEDDEKCKDTILAASKQYEREFEQVMGIRCGTDSEFAPSFDGGLDAVVELLDDVRTSAWNMAAFIWGRG